MRNPRCDDRCTGATDRPELLTANALNRALSALAALLREIAANESETMHAKCIEDGADTNARSGEALKEATR